MNRRLGCAGLAALVLVLTVTYARTQYGARERAAAPDPDGLPGRLLEDPSFDLVLWLPYPHQNLARVREALGGEEGTREWLGAVLRLAEVRSGAEVELALPAFGPFPVPPARELALAIGEPGGERGEAGGPGVARNLLAARIYPSLAWIGRSAGAVAGNPWLKGGEVRAFGGPARVSWDGTVWRVAGGEVDVGEGDSGAVAATRAGSGREPALARLRLGSAAGHGDPPAGGYRLFRPEGAPGDLELALEGPRDHQRVGGEDPYVSDPFEALAPRLLDAGAVAVWARGPRASRTGLAVLFDRGGRRGLPPAAVLAPSSATASARSSEGSRRLRLIHERLPSFLRDELERAPAGPWLALATDGEALAAVRELAARLPPPEALPDRFLWVDLPALRGFVDTVVELMEEVPLFPRRELRRWRDARTALAPLEGFDELLLLSRPERLPRPLWRLHLRREVTPPRH